MIQGADKSRKSVKISVRLQPKASREELRVWDEGGVLRVRVKEAPVDGAANAALVRLVAKHLGISRGAISIIHGATGRNKILKVEGLSARQIKNRLYLHSAGARSKTISISLSSDLCLSFRFES